MKKTYALLLLVILLACSLSQAQSVKIIKEGITIAEYSLSEIDEVRFGPENAQPTLAQAVAGIYSTYRSVTLPAIPSMGVLVEGEETVEVKVTGSDTVEVIFPSCQYTMSGTTFDLPSASVEATVSKDDDVYILSGKFEGTIDDKESTIDLTATIKEGAKEFEFVQDMKYGSMPMVLHMVYQPLTNQQ